MVLDNYEENRQMRVLNGFFCFFNDYWVPKNFANPGHILAQTAKKLPNTCTYVPMLHRLYFILLHYLVENNA